VGIVVYAVYSGVSVVGWNDGSLTGAATTNVTTTTCLPLYEHQQLVRVT
jgi:hypothetical protein